jgi:hypothetical protein
VVGMAHRTAKSAECCLTLPSPNAGSMHRMSVYNNSSQKSQTPSAT